MWKNYIRTKDGRIIDLTFYKELGEVNSGIKFERITNKSILFVQKNNILKQANTIEELCDEFVVIDKEKDKHIFDTIHNGYLVKGQYGIDAKYYTDRKYKVYGAIWTDKGLIYVAKMNNKGELELL